MEIKIMDFFLLLRNLRFRNIRQVFQIELEVVRRKLRYYPIYLCLIHYISYRVIYPV